jgi:hypothetical protein
MDLTSVSPSRKSFALLIFAVGCSEDGGSGPSQRIDELFLGVTTQEAEENRQLMVTGEVGNANVIAFRSSIGADPGQVSFASSNPEVVAIQPTTAVAAELSAVAAGSVEITASAQGLSDRVRVDVFDTPQPVDGLQVRLAPVSSAVQATYDAQGNLVRVNLAPNESAALDLTVERDGERVLRIPYLLTSTQPSTVRVDEHCRPPELDPQCDVFGSWGWVTAVVDGQSAVTVTVRNLAASFTVEVD